jgi:hypothetical protein
MGECGGKEGYNHPKFAAMAPHIEEAQQKCAK